MSFCELRKADLLLHEPALHCNKLLAISLKILLYLSYKINALNISYQTNNVDIAQLIVFWILASFRLINLFQRLEIPAVSVFCVTQFISSVYIHLDMTAAPRRLSSDIFKRYVLKLIYSVKLPSALNLEIKLTVVPATTAFTTVFHNESSRKEGHTKTLVFSFLITPVCFIVTSLIGERRAVIQLKQMLLSILNICSLYITKTVL